MSWLDQLLQVWFYTHLSATELQQGLTLASTTHATSSTHPRWKSWALTEVLYRDHDVVSKAFAIASFLPLVIVMFLSGLASAPCRERRLPALRLLLFLIISVALNVTCKASIRSQRPPHPAAGMNYTTVHGMPSDHSQFMAGFSVYLARRWSTSRSSLKPLADTQQLKGKAVPERPMPRLLSLVLLCATALVGVGRVYNGYHTVGQVLVGWAVGIVLGFVCTTVVVQRALAWVSATVMLPLMLGCTYWTNAVC